MNQFEDTIGQCGTLAKFRHFIENAGSRLVNIHRFTAAQFSAQLAPKQEIIQKIEEKFGREQAEQHIQELDVAGALEALTEREAHYLLAFASADALRAKAS